MTAVQHIALVPLMNAGFASELLPDHFDFSCGARLTRGRPDQVWQCLPRVAERDDISRSEITHWEIAGGWLWITSDEAPGEVTEENNVYALCHRLARKLEALCWFVDLCGGGENEHWRGGNNLHNCGVYVASSDTPMPLTHRIRYVYSTPLTEYRTVPWSKTILEHADSLEQATSKLGGTHENPRIGLANDLRHAMCAWDARRQRMRLQLAVSALETLLIAPSEHMYLWNEPIKQRLGQICDSTHLLSPAFYENIRNRRHNAVHRGGADPDGNIPKLFRDELHVETILREALCWAMINGAKVGEAFDEDEWPAHIPALGWTDNS